MLFGPLPTKNVLNSMVKLLPSVWFLMYCIKWTAKMEIHNMKSIPFKASKPKQH